MAAGLRVKSTREKMTRRERLSAIRERNENPLCVISEFPYIEDRADAVWLLAEIVRLETALVDAKLPMEEAPAKMVFLIPVQLIRAHNAAIDRALAEEVTDGR